MQNSLIGWIYIVITFETRNKEHFSIIGFRVNANERTVLLQRSDIKTTVSWKMTLCVNEDLDTENKELAEKISPF
jgi:hypothetical protein